ncbi:nuclear pore complex Nup85 [Brachionus plicatilis]|uniref:Nuclear pore complex protein Nup85 n=1 Tax=Brachionus plicatilis TaxID=10195 RepID=A0A3M7Q4R0_BRAPC|nr:nuclear pore complex Nup85 [Brachionus plicatilis]
MDQIAHLSSYKIFTDPSWRRVISQCREVFNDLHQNLETNSQSDTIKTETVNLSDQCLEANQKYIDIIENELRIISDQNENQEKFQILLQVWKLCQIIFIKSSPSGTLLNDLQEWYRTTNNIDPMIQNIFSSNSENPQNLYLDEKYWICVLMAVVQGRIETARHLLSFYPIEKAPVLKSIKELLHTMPNLSTHGHLSLFEFKAKWEYWQKKCVQVLTSENFQGDENDYLQIICKLLCADERTYLELKPIFNNWYYMLISYLSYSNPTFNISDLHMSIESGQFIREFEEDLDEFDGIIIKIFNFDVDVVTNDCVTLFSNNFFSAHFLDILFLNGKLQLKNEMDFTSSFRAESSIPVHEQHMTEYAIQLLSAAWSPSLLSLHQTAFDYLIKCKMDQSGIDYIEAYLERIPLTDISEMEASKIFYIAFQYGLHDLAFSIGRVMQMRALKSGLYGTALSWNAKIKDCSFGNILAEGMMQEFFQTNDIKVLELTESLSKEIIYSERLMFLNKYREFYKLAFSSTKCDRAESLKQAASLLVQLLEVPNLIPFKFMKRILFQVHDLVDQNVFGEDQLFSVLKSIQFYENRRRFLTKNSNSSELNECNLDDEVAEENKWKSLYEKLSIKIAENFVKNKIEF